MLMDGQADHPYLTLGRNRKRRWMTTCAATQDSMQNLQLIPANGARKELVAEVTVSYHDFFNMGHRLI